VSDIQRELQAVLNSIEEMTSTGLLKHGKNDGITVYVPKETILKETTAKIEYVKPEFLVSPSLGTFQYTLYGPG
jgi:hypothetical protein